MGGGFPPYSGRGGRLEPLHGTTLYLLLSISKVRAMTFIDVQAFLVFTKSSPWMTHVVLLC